MQEKLKLKKYIGGWFKNLQTIKELLVALRNGCPQQPLLSIASLQDLVSVSKRGERCRAGKGRLVGEWEGGKAERGLQGGMAGIVRERENEMPPRGHMGPLLINILNFQHGQASRYLNPESETMNCQEISFYKLEKSPTFKEKSEISKKKYTKGLNHSKIIAHVVSDKTPGR